MAFVLALFTLRKAMNLVRVIEVATIALFSAIIITITLEPWELKTIYQFITGNNWVISRPICQKRCLIYFARILHILCLCCTIYNISIIPLGMRYRSVGRVLSIVNASRSVQIEWRIHWIFTAHEDHTPRILRYTTVLFSWIVEYADTRLSVLKLKL